LQVIAISASTALPVSLGISPAPTLQLSVLHPTLGDVSIAAISGAAARATACSASASGIGTALVQEADVGLSGLTFAYLNSSAQARCLCLSMRGVPNIFDNDRRSRGIQLAFRALCLVP
jgi:hypothetical protein